MTPYQRHMAALCRADRATAYGNDEAARAAYGEAAAAMSEWVATLGDDKPKTRSVYSASLVALWYKAGDHAKARVVATTALRAPWLMEHSARRIRDLLDAIASQDVKAR